MQTFIEIVLTILNIGFAIAAFIALALWAAFDEGDGEEPDETTQPSVGDK